MTAGANRLTIRNSGFVGIGVDNPGYKFQVGAPGDGSVARANIWNTLSDERLKRFPREMTFQFRCWICSNR